MGASISLFQRLGGEEKLRAIIDNFIDRVFADRMIGFFFRNADRARIKELEYQGTTTPSLASMSTSRISGNPNLAEQKPFVPIEHHLQMWK